MIFFPQRYDGTSDRTNIDRTVDMLGQLTDLVMSWVQDGTIVSAFQTQPMT